MRDDQSATDDRENANRADADRGRRSSRGKRSSSGKSDAKRADAPAPLAATSHLGDAEAGLTDEEIALYRKRVAEGLYNSREVADEVARRMMRRGDI